MVRFQTSVKNDEVQAQANKCVYDKQNKVEQTVT